MSRVVPFSSCRVEKKTLDRKRKTCYNILNWHECQSMGVGNPYCKASHTPKKMDQAKGQSAEKEYPWV